MNILLATTGELEDTGGVTVVVRGLGVHSRQAGNHVVYLVPTWRGRREYELDGIRIYRIPMRSIFIESRPRRSRVAFLLFLPLTLWTLARILRREKIEVVNVHYLADCWVYFILLHSFLSFKLIFSVHGSDALGVEGPRNLKLLDRWRKKIARIVFCSRGFQNQVLSVDSPLQQRSQAILNGIDLRQLQTVAKPTPAREYIVFVAHLRPHKAQDVLLQAFSTFANKFPNLDLEFVGQGPLLPKLEALRTQLHLEDRVHFRGDLSREQALQQIAGARVFCLASRREPFGLVILEAMALGTPVVATRTGGIPEIVQDGENGLLVEPGSPEQLAAAICRLLEDESLAKALARNARERVQHSFTLERFAEDYRTLYHRVLNEA